MKLLVVLLCLIPTILFSNVNYFMPTDIGSSARMIGQGSIEGFSPHASVLFENPAALSRISQWSMSLFRTTYLDDYHYQNIALAYATSKGYFGFGYYGAAVNEIYNTGYNSAQEITIENTISYQNSVVKLAYANAITPFLMYGVTLSHYMTSLDPRYGSGTNLDVGILCRYF
jgi:hypothetical protein